MNIYFQPDIEQEFEEGYVDKKIISIVCEEIYKEITSGASIQNELQVNYSPKQPRDDSGKWVGSGSSKKSNKTIDLTKMPDDNKIDYLKNNLKVTYDSKEQEALSDYTGMDWATNINMYYRTGQSSNIEGHTVEQIIEKATIINNASKKLKTPDNMTLYRVTPNFPDSLRVGDKYTDKGFSSTSAIGGLFNPPKTYKNLKIQVNKGQPIINMSMKKEAIESRYGIDNQAEIILPLNTTYIIKSISDNDIELEVE